MQPSSSTPRPGMAQVKFNEGQALLHLANMYQTMLEVILEIVQNALDEKATMIKVKLNFKTRCLSVHDNGNGTTVKKFNDALSSVAEPGRKKPGSLGQFGLGLISPLGKCDYFVFTSCPKPQTNLFTEWKLVTKDIIGQKEGLGVPVRSRPDLTLDESSSKGKCRVEWRSEMSLHGITTDSYISRVEMNTLIGAIQDRYAATMRQNNTIISITIVDKTGKIEQQNVTAMEFRGRPIPERTLKNTDTGEVLFRLFIAQRKPKKGREGRVVMGIKGNDFRFPFHYFARSTSSLIGEEAVAALSSGLFEGEIICEKVKLHADRNTFVKDDAFISLCVVIEEWFDQFGRQYLEDMKQSRQEQRFQELGLRSMKVLEDMLKMPAHANLLEVIRSFGRGTIGPGHTDPRKKVVGEQERSALSVDGSPGLLKKVDPESESRNRPEPKEERKPHTPLTVAGPKGTVRKIVKSSSFGLQFAHEAMEGSPDLWKLDPEQGVLVFNIRHPLWTACDVRDSTLMRLQELVAVQALTLQMMPENLRTVQRQFTDELNNSMVTWILNSDKARGTIPTRKTPPPANTAKKT